ncbi:L-asparaginase [Scaptodrosophila lebanonensis]|uniref:asparaginase n=1 Tax=Drosophila lebanonensis TaxID=7225 RepID=A0A6J2T702_DROLE|nr:L-asparaginase [Scaptodrosophila lebanonensis]
MPPKLTCTCRQKKEARVHVIYTGGTIGMMRDDAGVLAPMPNELPKRLREYPTCHDCKYQPTYFEDEEPPLVVPPVEGAPYRVLYDIVEYTPLLDSSSMGMDDWRRIACDVGENYYRYDGFVILHGTDTLAYTASALAFMLENLGKPVVVTGAQIPIFETRTDGRDNFLGSLLVAGNYNIPEVLVFFGNKILRGCRTTKISSESFHAFDSPNQSPLGETGINIEINSRQIFRPCNLAEFSVHDRLEPNVSLLRFYPGITPQIVRGVVSEPMRGVVLQTFGAGNVPTQSEELLDELRSAVDRGVLIINITQCGNGMVAPIYETGKVLTEMGVVPGYDMTQEAALTKLAYVLAKDDWDICNKRKVMTLSIRGELTTNKVAKINDIDLVEGVARTLHLSTAKEREQMCRTFFPALVATAVLEGDVQKLSDLREYGADLTATNSDGRTALHLASYAGRLKICCTLLAHGCPVAARDRFNRTALHEAVDTDNHLIIQLLRQNGAELRDPPEVQAEVLRALAERQACKRLESFRLAGANLTLADRTGRTPLHYACQLGHIEVVEYLLPYYPSRYIKDELGMTPMDYAKAANKDYIVTLLRARDKADRSDRCLCGD